MTPRAFLVEIARRPSAAPVDAAARGCPAARPVWLARLFAGEPGVMLGTEPRDASNAKAKRELGWRPKDLV